MTFERIKHPQKLADRRTDPDETELSLLVLFDGWLEDLERLHRSVAEHVSGAWEIVVVDNPVDDTASERIASLPHVRHVPVRDRVGFGAGRNLALRTAVGAIACIVDTSVHWTGDVLGPLRRSLEDPGVGLVGRWGVTTGDGFEFSESSGPDVDAVEGYFMAMRRADLVRTGSFDPKFRFYRNADLDFSFQVRSCGLRTIVDPTLPLERGTHRLWEATPPEQREELSRKNFFRFREHWGSRTDLLVTRR